ncbi:MAG: hypothetical protein ACD_79C00304G0004 [uncultured bacterium]|nr:MAG: hypothetical protein ACD_79C00304G0004 [uncultured bacterium]
MTKNNPLVSVIMGSKSDLDIMKGAIEALKEFDVSYDIQVLSAHRAPALVMDYVKTSEENGVKIFICGAGQAAHLAGLVSANTYLPVIGVPVASGALNGMDALLATVQMPKGIPVATVAISGAYNAGLLAVQILSVANEKIAQKLKKYKINLQEKVKEISKEVQKELKS